MPKINIKKHENLKLWVIFSCLIVTIIILGIAVRINALAIEEKERIQKLWQDAESYCSSLFSDDIINNGISDAELTTCENKLDLVYDQASTKDFRTSIQKARNYLNFSTELNQLFDDNEIFKEEISQADLDDIERFFTTLSQSYQNKLVDKLNLALQEFSKITDAKNTVLALFDGPDSIDNLEQANILDTVNRDQYNQAKEIVDSLLQPNLKNKLLNALEIVENNISEKEQIERQRQEAERARRRAEQLERERILSEQAAAAKAYEEQAASAWHILNVPYISQNHSQVYNGCEAASLLMSLKYKGYLAGKDYLDFVSEMPKTDNPQTGFYLSIYDLQPKSEAHWIDTTPLATYGNQSSNSNAVYNLTGSSIETIRNEVTNDNPVIIYLTYNFNDLKAIVNGVPTNLHVMVLSGYNPITNEYQITDPWTRATGQYIFTVPGDRIESLYNQVGQRALVVK